MECREGIPEENRPLECKDCGSSRKPHRHGKFERSLFTLTDTLLIFIYRFLCPDCKRSFSLIPSFVEPHHQAAVEVKEEVVRSGAEGKSLEEIAASSDTYAGGAYAVKTLWRWVCCWNRRLKRHEEELWGRIVRSGVEPSLTRERHSIWKALFGAWQASANPLLLFSYLLDMDFSFKLAVR
jgi:hypothetical protein